MQSATPLRSIRLAHQTQPQHNKHENIQGTTTLDGNSFPHVADILGRTFHELPDFRMLGLNGVPFYGNFTRPGNSMVSCISRVGARSFLYTLN